MIQKKILLPTLIMSALLCPTALHAQQTKVLTADKSNEYGLVYTLPLTSLHVSLTARHDVAIPGPFFQYAAMYLGDSTPVTAESESWSLEKADVTPFGVADSEIQYLMQLKPGSLTSITVADDGMLLAINTPAPDYRKPDIADRPTESATPHIDPRKEYLKYVDQDFIACKSTSTRAKMLAEAIMEVRESRIALTRGTAETMPTDGRQLELMLNSLGAQEEALTAAFNGVRYSETSTRGFDYLPEGNAEEIICRISDFEGFTTSDDLSGTPVYVKVEITDEGELPVDARGETKKLPKDAIVYNIPGSAKVSISDGKKNFFSTETDFAQFGVTFGLAPSLFSDRRETYSATFNPTTGALVEIVSENDRQ